MSEALAAEIVLPGVSPGVYGSADFRAVADIVYRSAGIVLEAGKAMLVYSRLAPLVREAGCGTFGNYVARLRQDRVEEARAVAALTTNHTFFYREAHHFEHFAREVRPQVLHKLSAGNPVRMWSAGCSSGEETWSLLMTLLSSDRSEAKRILGQDLVMLASDLAPHAVKKAVAAQYAVTDLDPVPAPLRDAWVRMEGTTAKISDEVRALVRFRELNLLGEWPMRGKFDVIFCRNVMIYFDHPTKERLVARFADALLPGGYLYIGHSERVTGAAAQSLELIGPTIYQRRNA
ncbi:MAG: protein-glutamate O-methyltransferase CheR [Novosphingobium sp.]|nr:protein-glutamate O-methyltransferase CheR [Novosphingobium sp.]